MSKLTTTLFLMGVLFLAAILGLAQEGETESAGKIRDLIGVLDTRHWDRAVDELASIGEPAVEPLLEELGKHTRLTSARACYVLTRIGTQKAIEAVMEALKNPQNPPRIREYAAHALGDVNSETSILLLSDTLARDFSTGVRMYAARALGKIGSEKTEEPLIEALEDQSGYVRGTAAEELGNFKSPRSVAGLIKLLKDDSGFVCERARPALVKIGEPAVEPLLEALKDTENQVRWMAVWILGNIQSVQAVNELVNTLTDPEWMVREEAALALARINSQESVLPLIELLEDEKHFVREAASWTLGEMKAGQAVKPLIQALADRKSSWMAATALGEIQSREAIEPLIAALESDDLSLRRASVWALEKMPSIEMIPPLIKTLDDKDWEVRMWAAWTLEKIGTPQALEAIKKYNSIDNKVGRQGKRLFWNY
jgi:HEAT repeat protein